MTHGRFSQPNSLLLLPSVSLSLSLSISLAVSIRAMADLKDNIPPAPHLGLSPPLLPLTLSGSVDPECSLPLSRLLFSPPTHPSLAHSLSLSVLTLEPD